jgi:hypothetical protein
VADDLVVNGNATFKANYFRTAVDLSDTSIYYNSTVVTPQRSLNSNLKYYRLAEFWHYPKDMPSEYTPWYYKGIAIN